MKNKFKFSYNHKSSLSQANTTVDVKFEAPDLDEVMDHFETFLLGCGFDVELVRAALSTDESESYQDTNDWKELFETERYLKEQYKKELDKLRVEKECSNENDG